MTKVSSGDYWGKILLNVLAVAFWVLLQDELSSTLNNELGVIGLLYMWKLVFHCGH